MKSTKMYLQIPAVISAVLGLIITFVALATPAWQVVYARELQQWLQSGLWMSCKTRPAGMYMCSYALSHDDTDLHKKMDVLNEGAGAPESYAWQRSLFRVFLVGQLFSILSLVAFCFSHTPLFEKIACILFTTFIALAALICCGAIITFAVFSYMVDYRFYQVSVSGIYEKYRGYSFYLAAIGAAFYLLSLCLSFFYTAFLMRRRHNEGVEHQGKAQQYLTYGMPQFSQQDYFAMRTLPDVFQKPC